LGGACVRLSGWLFGCPETTASDSGPLVTVVATDGPEVPTTLALLLARLASLLSSNHPFRLGLSVSHPGVSARAIWPPCSRSSRKSALAVRTA
jgi:hypothetical protein